MKSTCAAKKVALGVAPAGFHEQNGHPVGTVAAVGEDDDPSVLETAKAIAARFGAAVAPRATADVDLIVVGSKAGTPAGRVRISAAAEYLVELARCPVIVLPRGGPLRL